MTVKKFEMLWNNGDGTSTVSETYERECEDVNVAAQALLDFFNGSLRWNERRRFLVSVTELVDAPLTEHVWSKTTAMSQSNRNGAVYDKMKCSRCGLTGKRYGVASGIVIDSPYKSPGYRNCAKAKRMLDRRSK